MHFSTISANADLIVAWVAAMSAFFATIVVSWSHLVPDPLAARLRQMTDDREAVRVRERGKLNVDKVSILRSEPKKIFKDIFDRWNLANQAEEGGTVQMLLMAGYRGQGPLVTFLAIRLVMPFVLFALAGFYVFVVLHLLYPFFLKLGMVIAAALLGYYMQAIYLKNRIGKRQKSIRRAWPDALDLILICVESGMGVESAFRKVSEEIGQQSIELAEELGLTTAELSYLPQRRQAYENLANRTGLDGIKGVVTCLQQAEKYGPPIGQSLRVFAQEQRDMRIMDAEKKAAGLPPKLTVPLIIFFLPVLFAVIITPAAMQISSAH